MNTKQLELHDISESESNGSIAEIHSPALSRKKTVMGISMTLGRAGIKTLKDSTEPPSAKMNQIRLTTYHNKPLEFGRTGQKLLKKSTVMNTTSVIVVEPLVIRVNFTQPMIVLDIIN